MNALRLPNDLLPQLQMDLDELQQSSSIAEKGDSGTNTAPFLLAHEFDALFTNSGYFSAARLAPPYMVRPAVVEACNMECADYPLTTDGSPNGNMSVVGLFCI